jgi:beta-galactosidase
VPKISVSDVYIRPLLNEDKLVAEVTVNNNNDKDIEVKVDAGVYPWISQKEKDGPGAPVPGSELASGASLEIPAVSQLVPAHGSARVVLSTLVRDRLKPWFPGTPNLYGLIVHLNTGSQVTDSKYTRFGWRQTTFKGGQFLLNGKPFVMKGDSWHFLGIPQMTRRYAWAWFTALHNANLNAVRLHAEPYPSFYLDVADEMGILVLDETAMWASDGGPKLDDTAYWKDSEKHITELVLRDRNHPSVFGWSVSNEIMPIVRGVMHNPPGMMDNLIKHYGIWADICRKSDPSRPWISADGEDDGGGKLPTYVVHYGGAEAMERGEKSGKPWGVGEAGNAYYGTPEQVAETNGERAYQSFEGRMEGVAASSYQSLVLQREKQAVYRSVFNLVWYGLQPLALGMKDTTKPPDITDGVFFTSFKEGQPGVQPERLGPYCTTLNPGYDPSLPLYKTWPLFDAIHDASAEPPLPCKWVPGKPVISEMPAIHPVKSIRVMGGSGSRLSSELKRVGVPVDKLNTTAIPQLLFIDGVNPPDIGTRALIDQVITGGGTVMVWGAEQNRIKKLNDLLPAPLELTSRTASSLVPETPDNITAGITPSDLYFSELHPAEIISQGLSGPLAAQSTVLLSACNTDWLKWNKQPEYAKTAMVLRSERETKPSGIALMMTKTGNGRLLVTTLPAAPRLIKAEKVVRKLLTNLGIPLETGTDAGNPLLKTGDIVRTLACGSFPVNSIQDGASQNFIDPVKGETIQSNTVTEGKTWRLLYNESGVFDFNKVSWSGPSQNAAAYLSFWVSSPRSLEDLLLEPNIPTVNLELATDDAVQVWLNGKLVLQNIRKGSFEEGKAKSEALKLRQGWNHFLIKVIKTTRGWQFSGRLTSNQPDFLATLGSALEKP